MTDDATSEANAISIAGRSVGTGHRAFIIAEVAQAHDGSLGMAHAYIDAAAEAGADAIKFQTHIANSESTLDEPFRIKFSRQDDTRYAYWKRMEFSAEQWRMLSLHAKEKGIIFLSSAFSIEAVELLRKIGMPAWKVGSGEVGNLQLLEAMSLNKAPILLSSGMSSYKELDSSVGQIMSTGLPLALLQCTSKYPTELEDVGLNVIDEFRHRYHCPAGLSDHSGTIHPSLAAMARGADLIEVHVTFDRRMFGPDTVASITIDELQQLTEARTAFHVMNTHPVEKDLVARNMASMRELFTKSIAVRSPLEKGTVLQANMLTLKKPGTGIPANQLNSLVGRRLAHPVKPERLLRMEDLE